MCVHPRANYASIRAVRWFTACATSSQGRELCSLAFACGAAKVQGRVPIERRVACPGVCAQKNYSAHHHDHDVLVSLGCRPRNEQEMAAWSSLRNVPLVISSQDAAGNMKLVSIHAPRRHNSSDYGRPQSHTTATATHTTTTTATTTATTETCSPTLDLL